MAQEALGKKKEEKMESHEVVRTEAKGMVRANNKAEMYMPQDAASAWNFAIKISKTSFCPPQYRGKPEETFIAMAYGANLGMNPLMAIQNIATINSKPSIYGDALVAVVQSYPETEFIEDWMSPDGKTAYVKIKRGKRIVERSFSEDDAKKARLWGKTGPWTDYPKRMLHKRAMGFAVRDLYADVLLGMYTVEEARDMEIIPAGAYNEESHEEQPVTQQEPEQVQETEQQPVSEPVIEETMTEVVEDSDPYDMFANNAE